MTDTDITDLAHYYEGELRRARLDVQQARAEVARMEKKVERFCKTVDSLLEALRQPGNPETDLTEFVIDTQTRVPVEPRRE